MNEWVNLVGIYWTVVMYLKPNYLFWRTETAGFLESLAVEMPDIKMFMCAEFPVSYHWLSQQQ